MKKIIGAILMVIGGYLIVRGHDISRSVDSQIRNIANQITGASDDKVMLYYVGGAVCCAVGFVMIFFLPSKR